jgi:hypothetical protein
MGAASRVGPWKRVGEKQTMSTEQRNCRRENIASLLYLDLHPNNGRILLKLNTSGMRISVAHPLTSAKPARFSFGLGSPVRIEGTGRIAWIAESGKSTGVCFVDLSESSLIQISQWLKSAFATGVSELIEPSRTTTQAVEAQVAARKEDNGDQVEVQLAPSPLSEFTTSSSPGNAMRNGHGGEDAQQADSATEECIAGGAGTRSEAALQLQPELAMDAAAPSFASRTGVPGQAAETKKITVTQIRAAIGQGTKATRS